MNNANSIDLGIDPSALTKRELRFMTVLANAKGEPVKFSDINLQVWNLPDDDHRRIHTAVRRLRCKRVNIVNHKGIGYSLRT